MDVAVSHRKSGWNVIHAGVELEQATVFSRSGPSALLDQIGEELLEQNVSMMAAVIREGVEAGTMRAVDPEKAAFILFVVGQTLFSQEHHPYEDLMPLLAEIVLEGLLPR